MLFGDSITLSSKDKIGLLSNLSTMLAAGISILETVDSLREDAKGNQKKLLTALHNDLVQGKHVYASFARFPEIFDKVTINIIKASEEAGTLDVTLKDIKEHLQKEMEFVDKIRSAMIYPILIFIVFISVMVLILVFVIPKMASVFLRMHAELPLPTRIMIFSSDQLIHNTTQITVGVATLLIFVLIILKKRSRWITAPLMHLPVISDMVRQIDITRFSRSMALLLSSGLTVTNALELCEQIVIRGDMQQMVKHIHATVLSGKRIAEGMRDYKNLVPTIVIKMVEAGEKTGSLDKALQDISVHMDYEVTRTLNLLTTILEPLLLMFIGIFVGGMMLSIIAPIYNLIGQLGAH